MSLRVFTAFSGYDSQCMALDRIGLQYDLVGWSEIDRTAIKAHNAVYPQFAARNYGDICKIDWAQVPDFDLFTYSSPCQDFSTAGLQRGGEKGSGTRSSLLWECERAIAAKRPKYLLFENVAALVSEKFIGTFNQWQLLLERMGYTNFTMVLNAKDYGVPQSRARVFMVSILSKFCDKPYYFPDPIPLILRLRDVLEPDVPDEYYINFNEARGEGVEIRQATEANELKVAAQLVGDKWENIHCQIRRVYDVAGCAPTQMAGQGGYLETKIIEPTNAKDDCARTLKASYGKVGASSLMRTDGFGITGISDGLRIRKLTPKECFRLMGVADADADKMIAALARGRCYQVAGNSIVVDVLAAIFRQLFFGNKNKNQQLTLL